MKNLTFFFGKSMVGIPIYIYYTKRPTKRNSFFMYSGEAKYRWIGMWLRVDGENEEYIWLNSASHGIHPYIYITYIVLSWQ